MKTLLAQASPYGSGQVLVRTGRTVSAAYLHDRSGELDSYVWLANHEPAPPHLDRGMMAEGLLPPMPAWHTRHPQGRARPRRRSLRVLWFEDGDGAAILERDSPLAVLPGRVARKTGAPPGYSQQVVGRTPLAWPLDEAVEGLDSRIERADEFWRWSASREGWRQYQHDVLAHLERCLGHRRCYWDADGGRLPRVGVAEHPATPTRPFTVYSTVGMSCQPMPGTARGGRDEPARIELAIATTRRCEPVTDTFATLAPRPWRSQTPLRPGEVAAWEGSHARRVFGNPHGAAVLLHDLSVLGGRARLDLSGHTVAGEPVHWLWLVPVGEHERGVATERGVGALLDELRLSGRDWVAAV